MQPKDVSHFQHQQLTHEQQRGARVGQSAWAAPLTSGGLSLEVAHDLVDGRGAELFSFDGQVRIDAGGGR